MIKRPGGKKRQDLLWVDADGDGKAELMFWNQAGLRLLMAQAPEMGRDDVG